MAALPMTLDEALQELSLLADATTAPRLSDAELVVIANRSARADADGLGVKEEGWTPTYDLTWAAARAWDVKAGKAAGKVDVTDSGVTVKRSDIHAHCKAQAQHYRSLLSGSI